MTTSGGFRDALANLGPPSGRWRREAGITTPGELERFGPVVADRLVKHCPPEASLNLAGWKGEDSGEWAEATTKRLRQEVEAA